MFLKTGFLPFGTKGESVVLLVQVLDDLFYAHFTGFLWQYGPMGWWKRLQLCIIWMYEEGLD
ncbi:hypothetical protein Pyn_32528 [Prunus yedoensis var. nudiflora]|uniref:Uncharacterized protein n=1 Tax=Prunus yedoensis var. nudiflora TaxID=2094558 RepID=A0A314UZE4_PRUYE|nr:hypothetical protein Pyn_32528 [Prunus yedoensis var. nudiflora]